LNNFGGDWTKIKIEILVEYAKAYLTIMSKRPYYKLMYFDGFAGSGFITNDRSVDSSLTVGAARRIVEIDEPRPFDIYYFVELDSNKLKLLQANTSNIFPDKKFHFVSEDCNKKLVDMANFLKTPDKKNYRTLAYIDPCGMQLEWKSLESLRGLNLDLWVLVPTGLGVNRLLKKDGQVSDAWLEKLELFLGLSKSEILKHFYIEIDTLFPEITFVQKEKNAIQMSSILYQTRLKMLFNFVSAPYELKNSTNSVMYHLYFASNNRTGQKIANDIVKKYNN